MSLFERTPHALRHDHDERTVTAPDGTHWSVAPFGPTPCAPEGSAAFLMASAGTVARRVAPFPPDWRTCEPAVLLAAIDAPPRARPR